MQGRLTIGCVKRHGGSKGQLVGNQRKGRRAAAEVAAGKAGAPWRRRRGAARCRRKQQDVAATQVPMHDAGGVQVGHCGGDVGGGGQDGRQVRLAVLRGPRAPEPATVDPPLPQMQKRPSEVIMHQARAVMLEERATKAQRFDRTNAAGRDTAFRLAQKNTG